MQNGHLICVTIESPTDSGMFNCSGIRLEGNLFRKFIYEWQKKKVSKIIIYNNGIKIIIVSIIIYQK